MTNHPQGPAAAFFDAICVGSMILLGAAALGCVEEHSIKTGRIEGAREVLSAQEPSKQEPPDACWMGWTTNPKKRT